MTDKKGFSTRFGFLMTSVGAAVGLGNIWGFPYKVSQNGGVVFISIYIGFVFLIGVPLMLAELKLGRAFGPSPVAAYRHAGGGFAGFIGLAACFVVLCYYFYFGGLILREIMRPLGFFPDSRSIWHLIFALLTLIIVLGGINGGIEKCSEIMVPALIAVLAILAVYAFSVRGGTRTVRFLFLSGIDRLSSDTIKSALGQALFSLSLGQCVMVTFGGYLKKEEHLIRHALTIPFLDTSVALLAALVVIPFAFKSGPSLPSGPGLLFETMPRAFAEMRFGRILSLAFFIPVLFAALTSAVSMLEVQVSALAETTRFSRSFSAALLTGCAVIFGLPLCFEIRAFPVYEMISEKILMTSCSLVTCLIFFPKKRNSLPELAPKGKTERLFTFILRFVTPAILIASALV